jgi:hypothetical protein
MKKLKRQNLYFDVMIWSIAVMYFLIMVMRDFLVPLLYSELMNGPLKIPL